MPATRVLLVDDDEVLRSMMGGVLQHHGFEITAASSVSEALKHISSNVYDVLLSDLHMPGAGDGLTVVSAMRHANPKAVTLLLSAFPEMDAAAHAILLQADQLLVKPMDVMSLIETIENRLAHGPAPTRVVESVASILERTAENTIRDWYELIVTDDLVMAVALTYEQRTGHLHQVFIDLARCLRSPKPIGGKETISAAAAQHGLDRRRQGYTAAMLVEESRMLQVSVFQTLQDNMATIDYSILLIGVMTIADELDSQLSQAMRSYIAETAVDALTWLDRVTWSELWPSERQHANLPSKKKPRQKPGRFAQISNRFTSQRWYYANSSHDSRPGFRGVRPKAHCRTGPTSTCTNCDTG